MSIGSLISFRSRIKNVPTASAKAERTTVAMPRATLAWNSQPVRLVITASVVLIAIIIVAVWTLLSNLRRDEIAKNERDLETLAMVLAGQIDRSFQSIEIIQNGLIDRMKSLGIASTADLERQMSGRDTYERLKDQISALPFIDAIVLTGLDGKLINFSRTWPTPPIRNRNPSRDRIFTTTKQTSYVGAALHSPANGTWVLPINRKISGPHGEFLGAVLGVMRLNYFEQLFKSVARDNDRSIALFTGNGTLIARYPNDEALRGKSFAQRAVFTKFLSRGRSGTVEQASVTNGRELLISGHNLPNHPLAVVITKRLDDALAGWHYAALYAAGAALIIALMVGFAAYLVIRKIAENVQSQNRRLDAALNNMSQGLSMFDSSARLIVWNERYVEMFKMPRDAVRPGTPLQDLIRMRIANGTFAPESFGDVDEYVHRIQARVAQGKPTSAVHKLNDGRVIAVINHPLADGGWVVTHEDITEARRREDSFRLLFDSNPVPMWVLDQESLRFLAVNDAAIARYGYSREQFMSMTVPELRPVEDRESFAQFLHALKDDQFADNIGQHITADGTVIDVAAYSKALTYAGHEARLTAIHDITKAKRAEAQLRNTQKFLDTIIENVPVPILVKDVPSAVRDAGECRYSLVNRAYEELFGISRKQVIGKMAAEFYPKEHAEFVIAANNDALRSHQPIVLSDHAVHTSANGIRMATAIAVAIRDDNDRPQYLVTVLQDVTERKRTEQRVARMAHYDNLTDLPNRITFNDALEAVLEHAAKTGEQFALLSLDLDGFKEANDTYGHAVGDTLLCEISQRLQMAAAGSFVARIGGDEFAFIDLDTDQPAAAAMLADRVLQALREEVEIDGRAIPIGATIGGVIYPNDGKDAKSLMINADVALYRAKAEARGTLLFYDATMSDRLRDRRALQDDLRGAIERNELLLHYQPQKKMTGDTVGFEALLRWQCPKRGLVAPAVFIPVAEETGLIGPIGEWVLREACREAASWPQPLSIAVNISPVQFRNDDLPGQVHAILLETGLAPGRLELEITEGVLIEDYSHAMAILARLKSLGVHIALDDFGTGYSSLSYLHAFSFDKIKIDRAFIGDLERNQHSIAIVRAVIDLGHSLNVPILAEGVETAEQHALLFRKGCDEVQGFYVGRPRPIRDYAELVRHPAARKKAELAGDSLPMMA
jgi:diguanylate cyclase (GGDEF)-like protein/PAS domain S-box-containing protein